MKKNDVGTSFYTNIKQQHFKNIIKTHLACTFAVIDKNLAKYRRWCDERYFYFDITAGPGVVNGEMGSPLIFLAEAKKYGKVSAVFIEKKRINWQPLFEKANGYKKIQVNPRLGDNKDILPEYFVNEKKRRFGLLYCDPSGNIPDFQLLGDFSRISCYTTTDILINCPAVTLKRATGCSKCKYHSTLAEELTKIEKKYWLIREPYGKHQFVFLLGTNWVNFPSFKKIGMYPIDSKEGEIIFKYVNYTTKEREVDGTF